MTNKQINNAFFSDLDLTLIYSHRAIKRYHGNSYETLMVEEHDEKPLSYLKLETWERLKKGAGNSYHFIPTTTRTFEQYSRIFFPKVKIDYSIVLNGAKIYINGVEYEEWSRKIHTQLNNYIITPGKLFTHNENKIMRIPGVNKVRLAGEYFIYIVKEDSTNLELENFLNKIKEKYGYIISHQGRKSYIVPPCIDKGLAVKEVASRLSVTNIISAGDSKLDISMDRVSNHFIQPRHGEAVGLLQNAHITRRSGIDSTVEILKKVENLCE